MQRPYYRPPWAIEEEAKLRQLWNQGLRDQKLADAMGRSAGAVSARVRLLGLHRAADPRSRERDRDVDDNTALNTAVIHLAAFRQSFRAGDVIGGESGLTADDLNVILAALSRGND